MNMFIYQPIVKRRERGEAAQIGGAYPVPRCVGGEAQAPARLALVQGERH